MTAPKKESVSLVNEWLKNEIPDTKVTVAGDYFTVEATVNEIEGLLKTKYSTYGKKNPPCTP
jgi:tripeptidyl-peptidase-1